MKICKLCLENPADKTNTHYLTDGIIRSCFSVAGYKGREGGLMHDLSNNKTSIETRFQRSTPLAAIEKTFGREPTDEEIVEAKMNLFAVDNFFCTRCEGIFTSIETTFQQEVLPKLRGHDFNGITEISLDEDILVRKFFLLQVWRTSVCDPGYKIDSGLQSILRKIIFSEKEDVALIKSIPLNINYLNTIGDDFEYTKNGVGIGSIGKNQLIMFNDFIIQIFASWDDVKFVDYFNVNQAGTFEYFTNQNEEKFKIKIMSNEERLDLTHLYSGYKAKLQIQFYVNDFHKRFISRYGYLPTRRLMSAVVTEIVIGSRFSDEPRYSVARYQQIMNMFIQFSF